MFAPACGEHDRVVADVRPRHAHQIAQRQAGVASEIDGVGDLGRVGFLDVRDVGICPNDLGAVVVVEVLNALARIARDPTKFDGVCEDARQNLERIVSGARSVDPLVAPAALGFASD